MDEAKSDDTENLCVLVPFRKILSKLCYGEKLINLVLERFRN